MMLGNSQTRELYPFTMYYDFGMSNKGTIKVLLIVALFFSLVPNPMVTAQKTITGTQCKKLHSTKQIADYKYTCKKVGKKLVWSNGVKVKIIIPTTTTAPPKIQTPTTTTAPPKIQTPTTTTAPPKIQRWVINTPGCHPIGSRVTATLQKKQADRWVAVQPIGVTEGYRPTCAGQDIYFQSAYVDDYAGATYRWRIFSSNAYKSQGYDITSIEITLKDYSSFSSVVPDPTTIVIPRGAATNVPASQGVPAQTLRSECVSENLNSPVINSSKSTNLFTKYGWSLPSSWLQTRTTNLALMTAYTASLRNCVDVNKNIYYVDPAFSTSDLDYMMQTINFMSRTFGFTNFSNMGTLPTRNGYGIILAKEKSFLRDSLSTFGYSEAANEVAMNPDDSATVPGWAFGSVIVMRVADPAIAAHEYFHTIQFNLLHAFDPWGAKDTAKAPNWLMEGSASFVACQISMIALKTTNCSLGPELTYVDPQEASTDLSQLENIPANSLVYRLGDLATSYLVSQIGFEKFLQIFTESSRLYTEKPPKNPVFYSDQSLYFKQAFKDVTGVPMDDFYTMFNQVRKSYGVPKIS